MRSPLPIQVTADHIEVEITDQVCVKTYHCVFTNPNPQAVVGGECYMEVEAGAQVDNLSLRIDGRDVPAEILDVARHIMDIIPEAVAYEFAENVVARGRGGDPRNRSESAPDWTRVRTLC